jgi:hypothetical protein
MSCSLDPKKEDHPLSAALALEAIFSYETLITTDETSRRHNSESDDKNFYYNQCKIPALPNSLECETRLRQMFLTHVFVDVHLSFIPSSCLYFKVKLKYKHCWT